MNSSVPVLADFETCADAVSRICRPYRLAAPRTREFRGSVRNFTAAGLNITELRLGRSRMSQDPAGPAASGVSYFSLVLQVCGAARVLRGSDAECLAPGDLVLMDSAAPAIVEVSEGTRQLALNFFHAEDLARLQELKFMSGRRVSPAAGPAALLGDLLQSVLRSADRLGSLDLRSHALDLLAATSRPSHPTARTLVRHVPDLDSITRHIDAHLHHSALCPRLIATHFNVSLRQLYRITAGCGSTPAAMIWERRLLRARQLLRTEHRSTITRIAHQCGFRDSAHFTRAYRREFGQAPSEARGAH